jgi:hypothetical protein
MISGRHQVFEDDTVAGVDNHRLSRRSAFTASPTKALTK